MQRNRPTGSIQVALGSSPSMTRKQSVYGEQRNRIYDDLEHIREILTFPDHVFHRTIDKMVLQAGSESSSVLKTATVSPTTVYGEFDCPLAIPRTLDKEILVD